MVNHKYLSSYNNINAAADAATSSTRLYDRYYTHIVTGVHSLQQWNVLCLWPHIPSPGTKKRKKK